MKNIEKYPDLKTRKKEFEKFCNSTDNFCLAYPCGLCPFDTAPDCQRAWEESEADDDDV